MRRGESEKGKVLLRGVGTLRYVLILSDNLFVKYPCVQWQPDGLTIHTKKWFLGVGYLGAPPISLSEGGRDKGPSWQRRAGCLSSRSAAGASDHREEASGGVPHLPPSHVACGTQVQISIILY